MNVSCEDCTLRGQRIPLDDWSKLSSLELGDVVGQQSPSGSLEDSREYRWSLEQVPLAELISAGQDGEPEGGWLSAYERQLDSDKKSVLDGSPAYGGRDDWIRQIWAVDSRVFPLFIVKEDSYRLWDGHHRLAGAFRYGLKRVWCLVGVAR